MIFTIVVGICVFYYCCWDMWFLLLLLGYMLQLIHQTMSKWIQTAYVFVLIIVCQFNGILFGCSHATVVIFIYLKAQLTSHDTKTIVFQ